MLAGLLILALLALVVWGTVHLSRGGRYSKMTEEEFEEEAKRASMIGAGTLEFQRFFDPQHKVDYLQQLDKHIEAERDDSGDRPPEDASSDRTTDRL